MEISGDHAADAFCRIPLSGKFEVLFFQASDLCFKAAYLLPVFFFQVISH